jgi:hypothetical protein
MRPITSVYPSVNGVGDVAYKLLNATFAPL